MYKFTLLGFILILASCATNKKATVLNKEIWINSIKVPCQSESSGRCLQFQENKIIDPAQWEALDGNINGFNYKAGNIYKLAINETQIKSDQAEGTGMLVERTLIEVLEEKRDPKILLNDIWVLYEIGGKSLSNQSITTGMNRPRIEINLSQLRILGNDGCNEIMGKINLVDGERLEFGTLGGTKKLCPDQESPEIFRGLLRNTKQYSIAKLKLALMDQQGKVVMRFQKVE